MSLPVALPETPVPGLDAVAAQRWRTRARVQSPWLHEEIGRRMAERLPWIKQQPQDWLDWMPLSGGWQAHRQVAALYPQAKVWVGGSGADTAAEAMRRSAPKGWNPLKWWGAGPQVHADQPEVVDLLWANMALHQEALPKQRLAAWARALRVQGFLMFSCLGPDSLRELRAVYAQQGWPAPGHAYTDMHDWGDMLVEVGYAEPVMDMERIALSYPNAERLLADLRDWGRNLHQDRFAACRGRGWRAALVQALERGLPRDAQGQLLLEFEVIYGHAVKPAPKVPLAASSQVPLAQMRAMLRQGRV